MEEIIKWAIKGGYKNPLLRKEYLYNSDLKECGWSEGYSITFSNMILDPMFWQALGKACGWLLRDEENPFSISESDRYLDENEWQVNALIFHTTNLTEGWDKALEYLNNLIKK